MRYVYEYVLGFNISVQSLKHAIGVTETSRCSHTHYSNRPSFSPTSVHFPLFPINVPIENSKLAPELWTQSRIKNSPARKLNNDDMSPLRWRTYLESGVIRVRILPITWEVFNFKFQYLSLHPELIQTLPPGEVTLNNS